MGKQDMRKRIWSCAGQLVDEKGYVSPVDLLVKIERITKKQVEDWRFKRIPYLEQVTDGNLSKMKFILNELREFGKSAKLKSSQTVYVSWGKGPKHRLRFSKSGDPSIETTYSTHYVLVETKEPIKETEPKAQNTHSF
ncbi:hypothetical protein [Alicyclobacillus mengziensis]|nr:hypothetical protein [Alicyclobacillus mengziensis]